MRQLAFVIVLSLMATPRVAFAHHEAIFGPQSAAVLSAPRFVSAQFFTRQTGKSTSRRRQTTAVISGGLQPFRAPLSVSVVVPVSFIGSPTAGGSQKGIEDILLSGRYKVESARLTEALHLDESYVMGVGGVELPTGTIDHPFGKGAPGAIAAALVSAERRPVSGIGYAYYHHTGVYQGARESGNIFWGGGVAWTPLDNLQTGRLFSLQAGISRERTFAAEADGFPNLQSGGSGVFAHEAVMVGLNEHIQVFTLLSLPIKQSWASADDRQQFRLGAGTVLILGR